jgi:chromosome segregation ATPase
MEELEGRVTALEEQMREVRENAAAARVLAGGADRDVGALGAKVDAHTRLLGALRETQVEDHGHILELQKGVGRLERRFEVSDQRFGRLEQQVGGLTGRFDGLEQRFDGLEQRFDGLEQRFDGVEQRFDGVEQRFDGVEQGQAMILDLLRRRNGEEPPASAE